MKLQDKTILITGAGSGIGRAVSLTCAGYGAAVAALDIDQAAAEKTAALISGKGGQAIALQADITNRGQVSQAVAQTVESFGKIDVLLNNAGSTRLGEMTDITDQTFDFIISLNLKGPFIVSTEAAKVMIPRKKGRIINITSYCAVRGEYANAPYCMAKSGVQMMTQIQALEWGKHNISSVAVAPGDINTELLQDAFKKRAEIENRTLESVYQDAGKKVPLGRVGEPQDIAELVAFLSDDRSIFINGSQILATGGYIMA